MQYFDNLEEINNMLPSSSWAQVLWPCPDNLIMNEYPRAKRYGSNKAATTQYFDEVK